MIFSKLSSIIDEKENLTGFYRGIVEDNEDPEKTGRCRIRVFGIYNTNPNKVSTDLLPWALPWWTGSSIGLSAGGCGYGFSIPEKGSMVLVWFEGADPMKPVYAPGIGGGIADPGGPVGEPSYGLDPSLLTPFPIPKASPGGDIPPWITKAERLEGRSKFVSSSIETAFNGTSWNEPEEPLDSSTGYIRRHCLWKLRGGMAIYGQEKGVERKTHLLLWHPTGTLKEIDWNGNVLERLAANLYIVNKSNEYKYISGSLYQTIDNEKRVLIKDNNYLEINKSNNEKIHENNSREVGGSENISVDSSREISIGSSETKNISSNWTVSVGNTIDISSSSGTIKISTNGSQINIECAGIVTIKGTAIQLQGPVSMV